jgi:uncharacterized protein YecE (DUF72 family)
MKRIYIGACSWSDFTHFYPHGLPANQQVSYYAQRFSLVEIDSTYYRIMPERNFTLWAERTPPGFIFDVKAFQQLTFHDREHPPTREVAAQFSASVQPLRDAGKLGALHLQFAPWFTCNAGNLEYILSLRAQYPQDQLSVELRHRSWYGEGEYPRLTAALRSTNVGLTVVDEPQVGSGSVPTVLEVVNPSLTLVRFHGRNAKTWYMRTRTPAERFNYLYSDEELNGWVGNLARLAELAETIHVLFNNNYQDYALENGRQLRSLLRQRLANVQVMAAPEE